MKKFAKLFSIFCFLFSISSQAQQIYECKNFGIKFVMDCECDERYMNPHVWYYHYQMKMVPKVTYVVKGSTADEMHLIRLKLFQIGDTSLCDKTPEQIIALFSNPNIAGKELWLTNYYNSLHSEWFPVIPVFTSKENIFPQPTFSPTPNGQLMLGTFIEKYKSTGYSLIIYENGDTWYGNVTKKIYPDYSTVGGMYYSHDAAMQINFEKNKLYLDTFVITRAKFVADSIETKKIANKKIQKWRSDSLYNTLSLNQVLDSIENIFHYQMLCGVGIEFKQIDNQWIITDVEKYSPAWLGGLQVGDRLSSFDNDKDYIYQKSKLEVLMNLTGPLNKLVNLFYVRPSRSSIQMNVVMNCFRIYKNNLSVTYGCVSGDCQNGKGIYLDEKGNIYDGNFTDGKLNGLGKIIMPHDSMVITSNFFNGRKNGTTTIATGAAHIYVDDYNNLNNCAIVLSSNFINDFPDGFGTICYSHDVYHVRYENGIVQGKALRILYNNFYEYADVNANYTLSNKLLSEGKPDDVSMMPAPVVSSVNSSTTTDNTITPDPSNNQPTDEGENMQNILDAALTTIEGEDGGYSFSSHDSWVVHADANYDLRYVTVTVPAHKSVQINFVTANIETEKIVFLPHSMSFRYGNTDGGVPNGSGQSLGQFLYWQYYNISNQTDNEGSVMIEIRANPSSHYFTRTIVYSSGISK